MRRNQLLRDETAATAIEYGLIAALIAVACIMAFQALGLSRQYFRDRDQRDGGALTTRLRPGVPPPART